MFPTNKSTFMAWCGLILGSAFFGSARTNAQPLVAQVSSIESVVANADQVFVATLLRFEEPEQINGHTFHNVVIEIEQTIKQGLFDTETPSKMQVHFSVDQPTLTDWRNQSSRLLVAVDLEDAYRASAIELTRGAVEVFGANFRFFKEPEEVIRVAKEYARSLPTRVKRLHTFRLKVPPHLVEGTKWDKFHSLLLEVPVDSDLGKLAIRYIESEDYGKRYEGVRAIRYFRSKANVPRVKKLLDDDGWSIYQSAASNGGVEVRYYGVRAEAYRTLKSWGISVEKPVARRELAKPTK